MCVHLHAHTYTHTHRHTAQHPQPVFLAVVNLEKQIGCPELNLTFPCTLMLKDTHTFKQLYFQDAEMVL